MYCCKNICPHYDTDIISLPNCGYASKFFLCMWRGELMGCGGSCRNPYRAVSAPVFLFHTHITLFFYVFYIYIYIYTHYLFFLFSLRLLKSFFSCHRYKYNIYCFFFTHSFVYSFIYISSLPTPQRPLCHPTRFQNMISVWLGSWFKRMPFPIQPTKPESFQRKWYS